MVTRRRRAACSTQAVVLGLGLSLGLAAALVVPAGWSASLVAPAGWSRHAASRLPRRLQLQRRPAARGVASRSTEPKAGAAVEGSEVEPKLGAYVGPIGSLDDMVAGCDVESLGLQILLGPSKVCDGLGVYIKLNDETESSLQPRGTLICGYSRGTMVQEAAGPFTVAFCFGSPFNGVVFEKQVMPLFDAIGKAATKVGATQLQDILEGHKVLWDAESEEVIIDPIVDYPYRYFVPDAIETAGEGGAPVWGPTNLGMYANDMGYSQQVTEKEYESLADKNNVLRIVWRLEMRNGKLAPSWPVVISSNDVLFENKEPMEVGLKYGWWYWKCAREEEEKGRKQ